MTEGVDSNEVFRATNVEEVSNCYLKVVKDIYLSCSKKEPDIFTRENISLSKKALSDAIAEIRKDVNIIIFRRQHPKISFGKYAGIVAFRLSRWNIISVKEPLNENTYALKLNYLVAIAFTFKYCLKVNIDSLPEEISKEIQYTIARRHTNQESLGICFDVIYKFHQNEQV